jgi:hypothetical protein
LGSAINPCMGLSEWISVCSFAMLSFEADRDNRHQCRGAGLLPARSSRMKDMTVTSKILAAPGPAAISGMIVGAAIFALPMIILAPTAKEKKGLRSGRQHIVHHHRCDRATARDVSNPAAGLQDQHAALERHRDREAGHRIEVSGEHQHAVRSQYRHPYRR